VQRGAVAADAAADDDKVIVKFLAGCRAHHQRGSPLSPGRVRPAARAHKLTIKHVELLMAVAAS